MSLGSMIIKSVIGLGACACLGYAITDHSSTQQAYDNNQKMYKSLKEQYKKAQKDKPTVEIVKSNYQKALDVSNKYLELDTQLHDAVGDRDKTKDLLSKINNLTTDSTSVRGPMVAGDIKDWNAKTIYGGQNSNGKIMMAYQFYNNDNKLMMVETFYYNVYSGKLSGFSQLVTKDGQRVIQETLRG